MGMISNTKETIHTQAPVDPYFSKLLANIPDGKCMLSFSRGETVFAQGDPADAVWFIQSGSIKISVVSSAGKEAVLAILGSRRFFGEYALAGASVRQNTATTLAPTTLFRVDRSSMARALQSQSCLTDSFVAGLLTRNVEVEEDLCSQLFNLSEKRLARVLLILANSHENSFSPEENVPFVSHEILAEMVGTTRPRITYFLNQFRKRGLIDYDHTGFIVRPKLLGNMLNE